MQQFAFIIFSLFILSACGNSSSPVSSNNPQITTAAINTGPLAATPTPISAFPPTRAPACGATRLRFQVTESITRSVTGLTEGLMMDNGVLYESTGLISGHGPSVFNEIDPVTGKVVKLFTTPNRDFGEGLVKLNGSFYQLTYQDGNIYRYSTDGTVNGTRLLATYANPLNEGWGLTSDGKDLLASDGSSEVYRLDPNTLQIRGQIKVIDASGKAISGLNELEYVDGQIYANIFPSPRMIRFDATSGCQTGEIDLSALKSELNCPGSGIECGSDSVTNGIAYDPYTQNFYLTGKSWPMIYEGRFQ